MIKRKFNAQGLMQTETCDIRCIHEDRVERAQNTALPINVNESLSQLFKTMGDPNRLKLLWALDEGEMCVCDLAGVIGISESAVSHQLRLLRQLNLVTKRREGPVLYYSLNDEHVSQLIKLALEHIREEK